MRCYRLDLDCHDGLARRAACRHHGRDAAGAFAPPRLEDVPAAASALLDAQGARAAPVPGRARSTSSQALDDVSFDVAQGEFFGVVGRNGTGKSTLLRCLAGIYRADAARSRSAGRVSPFIELGVGFNPELTARDNVILNAMMLGLTPQQARERFDAIIAFAELEEFLDLRLKNYSSGMQVRLGFSVAIQVEAEILLVDEVLAVGDAAFQQKCYEEFQRLKDEGRTVVFVTHDMSAVERFCDRAMLLEKGEIVTLGTPATSRAPTTS